ncbi:hypothetical protein WDW37_15970 [Bdellovibrionota bacterium FG-1]
MPRKNLIRNIQFPYHVTARSNNREPFPFEVSLFWKILCDQSFAIGMLFDARIHALVLMPNHFHMIISAPEHDLGVIMQEFMRSVTKTTNLKNGRSGRIFGASYHWTLINSPTYFAHAYKYVYRNPVRAGLCQSVEDFPFSTIENLSSIRPKAFPLWYPFGTSKFALIPNDISEQINWLNTPFLLEHEQEIQKALAKTIFQPSRQGWKRTLSELAKDQLI